MTACCSDAGLRSLAEHRVAYAEGITQEGSIELDEVHGSKDACLIQNYVGRETASVRPREKFPLTTQESSNGARRSAADIDDVLEELAAIRADMVAAPAAARRLLDHIHDNYRDSAKNLLHYLALRRRDLRSLQHRLAALGLSSLGRAESHALATVDLVLEVLHHLAGRKRCATGEPPVDFAHGQRLLADHSNALLGVAKPGRSVRIMVTMPSEAGRDYTLVHELLAQGMDCMRINCAHDDGSTWARMIQNLRRAEQSLGRSCRIIMDLAGPKLRTGPLRPGPAVVRARPRRDVFGRVTAPARLWLTSADDPQPAPTAADACLPVPTTWLQHMRAGQRVRFTDARNARRTLQIVDVTACGCWAEATQTAYIIPGTVLRSEGPEEDADDRHATVGSLTPTESAIAIRQGDRLVLTRNLQPGFPATTDSSGKILTPATIGCTIPEVFDDVRTGEPIWFDDGKIGGVIETIDAHHVLVRITHASFRGAKLRADKGINLPESRLRLPALTAKDLDDLRFVAQHADVVELSFANSAADVESLQHHLASLSTHPPAVVLKIETRRGFENLPEMLLTAMRASCCGVMIARGDLAVECGFERLAEVQEEILWICEAAHVPVIWATQVLETLAKEGLPSRAEISDAAMGHRAECVMLNKGPHMVSAVRVLEDILRRMQTHQAKKQSMLRELRLAHALPADLTSTSTKPGQ